MDRNKVFEPIMNVALRVPPLIIINSLSDGFLKEQILESQSSRSTTESSEAFYVVAFILG